MPDDSFDPQASGTPDPGKEEPGEFTRIFQSLQSPAVSPAAAPETKAEDRRPAAQPESFTQMFQALGPEPLVSPAPAAAAQETAGRKLSPQSSTQDAASFTQLLNSILRPGVKNPPAVPTGELGAALVLATSPEASLPQTSPSIPAHLDRDNEVTRIFVPTHPQPATPAPTRSLLQRYLPLLVLLNAILVAILGILVFLFLRRH